MLRLILILKCILFLLILVDDSSENNCGVLVKSLCDDTISTKWNTKDLGNNLRAWFESMKPGNEEDSFLDKKLIMERKTRAIRYIANFDCNTNHSIGPVWRTAGMISKHQFRDGFLYGIENHEGKMTGKNILHLIQKSSRM